LDIFCSPDAIDGILTPDERQNHEEEILIGIGITLLVVVVGTFIVFYPAIHSMTQTETVTLDPSLTLMLGGGGNSGIIIGDSAVGCRRHKNDGQL